MSLWAADTDWSIGYTSCRACERVRLSGTRRLVFPGNGWWRAETSARYLTSLVLFFHPCGLAWDVILRWRRGGRRRLVTNDKLRSAVGQFAKAKAAAAALDPRERGLT